MKEFFGTKASDKKTLAYVMHDGAELASKTISEELEAKLKKASDEAMELAQDQAIPVLSVPLGLRVLCGLLGFGTLVAICLAVNKVISAYGATDTAVGLKEIFNAGQWYVIAAAALFIGWIAAKIAVHFKKKEIKDPARQEKSNDRIEALNNEALKELGVPFDAASIDTLHYQYSDSSGENIVKKDLFTKYWNISNKFFVENGDLCIADNTARYDIPLDSMKSLKLVPESGNISSWQKKDDPESEPYRDHVSAKADSLGRIGLKKMCLLTFESNGEEYVIRFPGYEAKTVARLTGLPVSE